MDAHAITSSDGLRAAGLVALGVITYAWGIEPYRIQVVRPTVEIPNLPEPLDGLTICHLSDLHVGAFRRLEKALYRKLRGLEVDLCLISGDLLHAASGFDPLARTLSGLRTRHGIYAVPGNAEHDPWAAGLPVAERLEERGIRALVNRAETITVRGVEIAIAGVDDPYLGLDDPEKALADTASAGLRVLLAHSPDIVKDLGAEVPDLILCGHTHGGQIRLPFTGALWLHSRHSGLAISDGLYGPDTLSAVAGRDLADLRLYVSRGLGGSGIRARFMCRPEVTVITLRNNATSGGATASK